MKKNSIAFLGLGNRGGIYADFASKDNSLVIKAVCDVADDKLLMAQEKYNVSPKLCYKNENDFFKMGKLADFLVITTQDKDHYRHTIQALKLGYDILLEKPISPNPDECIEIAELAKQKERKVVVCHVLRYTPFYSSIKELLDSKILGDVVSVNQSENVGWGHFTHSFVRGNWRNSVQTSPIILAKCCHDLDIINWLVGDTCEKVSSFGSLSFYNKHKAPEGSADFCCNCSVKNCMYNSIDFYNRHHDTIIAPYGFKMTRENITAYFSDKDNIYARCVFHCDNDVCDRQTVSMVYQSGVCANLLVHGFADKTHRHIHIRCSNGELEGMLEDNKYRYKVFNEPEKEVDLNNILESQGSGHAGGDSRLFADFIDYVKDNKTAKGLTSIDVSVASHLIADAAEKSRLDHGKTVVVKRSLL